MQLSPTLDGLVKATLNPWHLADPRSRLNPLNPQADWDLRSPRRSGRTELRVEGDGSAGWVEGSGAADCRVVLSPNARLARKPDTGFPLNIQTFVPAEGTIVRHQERHFAGLLRNGTTLECSKIYNWDLGRGSGMEKRYAARNREGRIIAEGELSELETLSWRDTRKTRKLFGLFPGELRRLVWGCDVFG